MKNASCDIIAKNILHYLQLNNISRKELAAKIDVPYTTLCTWLQAKAFPRIDSIEKMAQVFGVNPSDLIGEKAEAPPLSDGPTAEEQKILDTIHSLPEKQYKALLALLGIEE